MLRDAFNELMQDDCGSVLTALTKKIDVLVSNYLNSHAIA